MLRHHLGRGGAERISIGITAIIITPALFRCSSRPGAVAPAASRAAFNVPLPLILPDRVLPGKGEVRDIVPHFDKSQLH
jgi:hypothetical protein